MRSMAVRLERHGATGAASRHDGRGAGLGAVRWRAASRSDREPSSAGSPRPAHRRRQLVQPALGPLETVELVRAARRLTVGRPATSGWSGCGRPLWCSGMPTICCCPGRWGRAAAAWIEFALGGRRACDRRRRAARPHRWPRPWVRPLTRLPGAFAFVHCVWSVFLRLGQRSCGRRRSVLLAPTEMPTAVRTGYLASRSCSGVA